MEDQLRNLRKVPFIKGILSISHNSRLNKRGFTLIELLVTIAIIAIISVVAVALFGNVQANARDGKRRSELESIANALEVNRIPAGYQPIDNTDFGGLLMPGNRVVPTATNNRWAIDPQNRPYCINSANPVLDDPAAIGAWAASATPATAAGACSAAGWAPIVTGGTPVANTATYKICTWLETGVAFCRTNTQ